ADGRLDTVTLDNYTGDPANPSAPVNLVESSRAYDPAGRMVSITDSMGNATLYTYTDNGLVATITRSSSSGASFTEQANTYDAGGNLVAQVTNNGATTTNYTVDAADRVTSQTLDPSGLDRVTNVTYSPDDQVITKSLSGSAGTPARVTDFTYDGMGNQTSQSVHDDNAAQAPAGWWPLTDGTGTPAGYYPTTAADDSGNGSPATRSSGVTWNSGSASFNGTSGSFTTSAPVVDTTKSFTVSAWVNLAGDTSGSQTVVSQDAGTDSGFYLKYYPTTGTWQFMRPLTDTANAATASANSNSPAVTGTWTFLTGTYNAGTGAVTLYVNGAAASVTGTDTTPIASSGALAIGRAKWDGSDGDWVDGQIANVQVYPYTLSATQVSSLYSAGMGGAPVGENRQTTKWTLDQRGLPTSMTDPDGNVTHYSYDEAGRLAVTTQPTITTQVHGGSATAAAPVTMTGYNTFGEPVESSDANGNVTVTGYDADGRDVSVTAPPYTPPGSSSPITAQTSTKYNSLGQVTAQTDPLGNQTTYTYDQLGDAATVTAPNGGVAHYTYDTNGDQLSATGPTGAQTQSTYDFMGRKVTSTQLERYPSTAAYTTNYGYGTGGWLSSSTSPDGVTTSYTYDAAGETDSVTDGAGNKTSYGYDGAGDRTSVTYPDGTQTTDAFDEAGRQTGSSDLSASGTTLRSDSAAYDSDGNLTASTDYRGDTTSYAYNAAGEMTSEVQPVSPTSGITTSFGYDPAGNQTLYIDGDGNQWWTTYNSWNLPESKIEPTTTAYPTAAQSTFTTAYDAGGRPVTLTEPGGVTVSDSYDSVGDLTGQSGSGASAATATRSFGYDLAGNMTSASTSSTAPQSQLPNATSESFTYDDQGLLLSASGSAGASSYTYNGDGQETSATTAAGTASYGYDNDGRVASMSDPATGATLTYSYNSLSQLSQISYGAGADSRAFGYNNLHELTSDTLATSSGQTVASIGYGYDANGNLTSKTTSSQFAGSAGNTYTYDEANRLTSWNNGTTTTNYGYDGAGNLTQAGSKTYIYDARDELTNDGTNAYSYTANGTLASEVTPSGTASFTADAYGQQVTEATQSYLYDALGRDLQVTSGSGGVTPLSYEGASDLLTSDGANTYTWTPDGTLTATGAVGGSASQGKLDYTDQHTDVVGQFTASGASLSGSAGYDPWGNVVGSSLTGSLGYQSQFTDPVTGKVQMGARFYSPGTGGFQDKDTATVNPVPDSAAANPFAYAGDNPLGGTDPTGHMLCADSVCGSAQFLSNHFAAAQAAAAACNAACQEAQQQAAYWASQAAAAAQQAQRARQQESSCGGWTSWFSPSCDLHRVESYVHAAVHYAMQASEMVAKYTAEAARLAVKDTSTAVVDAADWGAHGARAAWHTVQQAGSRVYSDAATWAKQGYEATTHAVSTAYHAVAKAATATAHFVVNHAATIASVAVSVAAFAGCEAVTAGAGTIGCAAIAGAAGNAVSYAITAAQTGHFSWSGLGEAALTGAVVGALSGGLAEGAGSLLSGVAGTLLRSGAEEASDALATSAT
ncbi:MAG TPA: LamG-like jellyroll fold domain-containing protein, partial [Mycobacterium sp.]